MSHAWYQFRIQRLSRLVVMATSMAWCSPCAAQSAAGAAEAELPEIVVEGASLAVAPAKQKKKAASQTPAGAGDVGEASGGQAAEGGAGEAGAVAGSGTGSSQSEASEDASGAQAVSGQGTAVSVVTGRELSERQIRNAADALRSLPGVSVSRQGATGNLTVVRLRGAESNHTLVLIDGVEVNSGTDGIFDFANLGTEDIERIEVLRGPQSGLYGSSALGGVINVITKSGKGPIRMRATAEGGSFETQAGSVQLSGGNDRLHGSFTLSGRRTEGFNISERGNEEDGSELGGFTFRGGAQVLDNLRFDATLRKTHLFGERDDGFGDLTGPFAKPADDLSSFDNSIFLGRVEATLDTFGGMWVHNVSFSGSETDLEDTSRTAFGDFTTQSLSDTTKLAYTSTVRIDLVPGVRHLVTGLVEEERETFEQPTSGFGKKERKQLGYAAEIRGEYFNILNLTGTVRRDDNEDFEDTTTWRTAASLKVPGTPLRVHGSAGTAVKNPSFSEQFGFFFGFVPNPDLVPEESFGWDAGAEASLLGGKAIIDVTYFEQNLENEIDFRTLPVFLFQPFNRTGESTREGVEVSARIAIAPGVTLGGAYTYLDARNDDGTEEVRRARHSGRADLDVAFDGGRGRLSVAAVYNGKMQDIVFQSGFPFGSDFVTLEEYWLVNAALSYKVSPGIELFGRVENLLDEDYQEIFGFETQEAAAFAGVRISLEDPNTRAWAEGR
jgi:vitamin B12 transporter